MNIWHDMHPDLIRKEEYTVFTANSMGSTAVLAFDGSTGLLQLEHLSDPYVAAPNNTGYLPRTYTENGMPVETVILCSRPLPPMTLVRCRPVGLITLHLDGGEQRKMLLSAACAAELAEFAVLLAGCLSSPQPVADSANAAVSRAAQSVFFQNCFIFSFLSETGNPRKR